MMGRMKRTDISAGAGIREKQQSDGTFINYPDETSGNITATVQGYVGMLASGCFHRSDPHMRKAEQFIISHGGLKHVHFMTKWMLAANGLYPWPVLYLPLSLMALPNITGSFLSVQRICPNSFCSYGCNTQPAICS